MKANTPILSVSSLHKQYGNKTVLSDVNFSVYKGEIFGFLGPNGAGKTTTIRCIFGAAKPTGGNIHLFGKPNINPELRRKVGFLSGDMSFEEDLTGKQYLEFVANVYGKDCTKQIEKLSELLKADLKLQIKHYSRGNRQKIGLIAALMHNPELLILDEPTSGFDPLIQEVFLDLIRNFAKRGGTVFMSSHILSEVQAVCDRVAFIRDGKIVSTGMVSELGATSAKLVRITANKDELKRIKTDSSKLKGLTHSPTRRSGVLEFTYSGPPGPLLTFLRRYQLQDIAIEEPDLETIFMSYYENTAKETN